MNIFLAKFKKWIVFRNCQFVTKPKKSSVKNIKKLKSANYSLRKNNEKLRANQKLTSTIN